MTDDRDNLLQLHDYWKRGIGKIYEKRDQSKKADAARRIQYIWQRQAASGYTFGFTDLGSWKKLFCKYVGYKIINPFNIDADLHSITHLTSHHCIKSLIAINPFDIDADLHSITHLTSHHCFKSLIASNPTYPSSTFILLLKCLSNLSLLSRKNAKISTWPRTVQCYPIPTLILPHASAA